MANTSNVILDAVSPVVKQSLQAHVYQELRRLLMAGHLRPGQELKVKELAEHFHTSVQPVREAILQLVTEKALEPAPNASARVPALDRRRLIDLRNVRIAMEGLAAELAVEHISDAQIDALERIVELESAADDARRVEVSVQQNRDFHFGIYHSSGSALLPPMIESLWLQVGPIIRDAAELFDARDGKGSEHHVDMIDALRRRDGEALREALTQDIHMFFDVVLQEYD